MTNPDDIKRIAWDKLLTFPGGTHRVAPKQVLAFRWNPNTHALVVVEAQERVPKRIDLPSGDLRLPQSGVNVFDAFEHGKGFIRFKAQNPINTSEDMFFALDPTRIHKFDDKPCDSCPKDANWRTVFIRFEADNGPFMHFVMTPAELKDLEEKIQGPSPMPPDSDDGKGGPKQGGGMRENPSPQQQSRHRGGGGGGPAMGEWPGNIEPHSGHRKVTKDDGAPWTQSLGARTGIGRSKQQS